MIADCLITPHSMNTDILKLVIHECEDINSISHFCYKIMKEHLISKRERICLDRNIFCLCIYLFDVY